MAESFSYNTGLPAMRSRTLTGDFSGEIMAFLETMKVCSRANRPERTAWLTISAKTSQADPGGNSHLVLEHVFWNSWFALRK